MVEAIAFAKVGSPGEDPFDLEGDLLDTHIRVEKLVGEGDLTVVYRGFHEALNAPVAIKCLNLPETLAPELVEPIAESFREGVRVHYRLAQGHLHVVQPLAFGTTLAPRTGATIPYFVREWLDGHSLAADFGSRARTKTRPRSPTQAVELLETAADALAHAHVEGVAHHSLSPTNLFLTNARDKEVLKVLDFGMARNPELSHADAGLRLLFSSYAAPEQLNRKIGSPCQATDVFAFALVLFETMAGRPYFAPGTHPSEMLNVIETREPLARRAPGISVPKELETVLVRALALSPKDRHPNLRAFWDDVKRATHRTATLQAAPKPLTSTASLVSRPPPSIPKSLHPTRATVSVLPVKMTDAGAVAKVATPARAPSVPPAPPPAVAKAPSVAPAPAIAKPAPMAPAPEPAIAKPASIAPAPAPAIAKPAPIAPAPAPAIAKPASIAPAPATPKVPSVAPAPVLALPSMPFVRAVSVPPARETVAPTPVVPPPPVASAPIARGRIAPLRTLPDFPPPPPLPPASSWTGEVAPPVVTSAVFPIATPAEPPPDTEGPRGPDTVPAPPMFADEAGIASRESLATLDDPLANDPSRWPASVAPPPLVANEPKPRGRVAAWIAAAAVGLAGVALLAIVGTTHVRATAMASSPLAGRKARGIERDPNVLVLADARGLAPVPTRAFDRAAVLRAFDETAADLGSCLRKGSPRGPGSIRVLVQPSGTISRLHIGPPYARTGTGACISEKFVATPLSPFEGSPRAVNYVFTTIGFD